MTFIGPGFTAARWERKDLFQKELYLAIMANAICSSQLIQSQIYGFFREACCG